MTSFFIIASFVNVTIVQAQMSLKFQSESLRLFKNESKGELIDYQYLPRGDTAENWTTMLVVTKTKVKTPAKEIALDEAEALLKTKKEDRFAAALVMESASETSIYLAQVKTVNSVLHSSLTRYFSTPEGLITYKWIRRMPVSRIPADENQKAMEQTRFVERENARRGDLIIDLSKKELPMQVKEDPRGMKMVPFRVPIKPNSQR